MSQKMVKFCSGSGGEGENDSGRAEGEISLPHVHFVHERVVEILCEGSSLTTSGREKFALGCYKSIFSVFLRNEKGRCN